MQQKQRRSMWTVIFDRLVELRASTLLQWWAIIVVLCALSYQALFLWAPAHAPGLPDGTTFEHFLSSLYFSIMTVTTVGYGDIVPHGASRAIAAFEGVAGFALFGLLVGKLSSRRQERVIVDVHRYVTAGAVSGLRSGLFVVRKDLDALIATLHKGKPTDDQWENLDVALMHAEVLVREIPALVQNRFATMGRQRDALLAEAVQRTVRRLQSFSAAAKKVSTDRYRAELSAFLDAVLEITRMRHEASSQSTWKTIAVETRELRSTLDGKTKLAARKR